MFFFFCLVFRAVVYSGCRLRDVVLERSRTAPPKKTLEGLFFSFYRCTSCTTDRVVQIFDMTCTWMSAMLNKAWYTSTSQYCLL